MDLQAKALEAVAFHVVGLLKILPRMQVFLLEKCLRKPMTAIMSTTMSINVLF